MIFEWLYWIFIGQFKRCKCKNPIVDSVGFNITHNILCIKCGYQINMKKHKNGLPWMYHFEYYEYLGRKKD